jgi:hypothetical protein
MDYQALVEDFARRTRQNLAHIRLLQKEGAEVYEVTALVNSMLGLLVFPQQHFFDRIPQTPLAELASKGWPIPRVVGDYPQVGDLRQLVRYLRNAISHFNVKFYTDGADQIAGLTVWNTEPRGNKVTWKATLTVAELDQIAHRFIALILKERPSS